MPLASLRAHPDKARDTDAGESVMLGNSYDHYGLLRPPFVLNRTTGNLLDGDQFLEPLRLRGIESVPVWVVEVPAASEDLAHLALQAHTGEWRWNVVSEILKHAKAAGAEPQLSCLPRSKVLALLSVEDWEPEVTAQLNGDPSRQEQLL